MFLAVLITAMLLGALWTFAVPMVTANSTVAGFMQNRWAAILITGTLILVAVFLTGWVLKAFKLKKAV